MEYSGGAVAVEVVAWVRWRTAKGVVECVPTISQSRAMYFPARAEGFGLVGAGVVDTVITVEVGFVLLSAKRSRRPFCGAFCWRERCKWRM